MIAQNDRNQARLTALLDRLNVLEGEGVVGEGPDLSNGLQGARLEMEMLRRRMNIAQEQQSVGENIRQTDDVAYRTPDSKAG